MRVVAHLGHLHFTLWVLRSEEASDMLVEVSLVRVSVISSALHLLLSSLSAWNILIALGIQQLMAIVN